jgi:DNA primase
VYHLATTMSDQVQQIKERLNIVDVVGQYVKLHKAGKNYKGLSPFNKEKTPSFFVNPEKGMYYDFSSGQGGDVFSFIEKIEGLDFKGALTVLAEKAGVTLVQENKHSRDLRNKLYAMCEAATVFFETQLSHTAEAKKYLNNRGIEDQTISTFRLGYVKNEWESLRTHLLEKGYTERELEQAGLIKKGESGKYYDRFRSRIIFPIFDTTGKVVAFSGRIHGNAAHDDKNAKYLNSPETPLFDKSRILYGFHRAKQHIRKYDFTILVEGQMDLVLSHQVGYTNTVAVSGTGLTEHHLHLIDKLSKKLLLAFDADRAGIDSCMRAANIALTRGLDVKVANIPEGKDPADCIVKGAAEWKNIIRESKHVIEYALALAEVKKKREKWDTRKYITYVEDTVYPLLRCIQTETSKDYFAGIVSVHTGISKDAIRADIVNKNKHKTTPQNNKNQSEKAVRKGFSRKDDLEKTLSGFLFSHDAKDETLLKDEFVQEKAKLYQIPLEKLFARYADTKEQLIDESDRKYEISEDPMIIVTTLMKDLAKIYVDEELELVRQLQVDAERAGDTTNNFVLDTRVSELSKLKQTLE